MYQFMWLRRKISKLKGVIYQNDESIISINGEKEVDV